VVRTNPALRERRCGPQRTAVDHAVEGRPRRAGVDSLRAADQNLDRSV